MKSEGMESEGMKSKGMKSKGMKSKGMESEGMESQLTRIGSASDSSICHGHRGTIFLSEIRPNDQLIVLDSISYGCCH